jgi:hypothetical protein
MIAYKGFNKDLACTRGNGTFRYEIGKTYTEDSAKCAKRGFHCVEEPIEVLKWYSGPGARYCKVDARGDINEDGDERISCTEIEIIKELTLRQLGILECNWIIGHPARKCSSQVKQNQGVAKKDGIVIVRGKHPKAKGEKGATLFLLKEVTGSPQIETVGVFLVGEGHDPDTWYNVDGRRVRCRKKN